MPPANTMASAPPSTPRGTRRHTCARGTTEYVDRQSCASIIVLVRFGQQIAHVVGQAGKAQQSRLLIEHGLDLRQRQSLFGRDIVEHGRIDVAGACAHDQPLERRESHGGVDRTSAVNGAGGASIAEVQRDNAHILACSIRSACASATRCCDVTFHETRSAALCGGDTADREWRTGTHARAASDETPCRTPRPAVLRRRAQRARLRCRASCAGCATGRVHSSTRSPGAHRHRCERFRGTARLHARNAMPTGASSGARRDPCAAPLRRDKRHQPLHGRAQVTQRCRLRTRHVPSLCRIVTTDSPPMRSISPRTSARSLSAAMALSSVTTTWNLSVADPALSTSTFIARDPLV